MEVSKESISSLKKMGLTRLGHNRVMTFAPVALAALKAFGMEDDEMCRGDGF